MRHAARQPEEEPAPERAALEAQADLALAGHRAADAEIRAVSAEIRDALRFLPAAACDERLAVMLAGRLEVVAERLKTAAAGSFDSGTHLWETRAEMARYAAVNAGGDSFFELGRAYERSLQDAAAKVTVPGQHRRTAGRRVPGPGQLALVVMDKARVLVLPAAAGAWAALRHSAKGARHIPVHGAVKVKAAALAAAAGAGAGALAITGAVVISHSSGAHGPSSGGAASVPGWHTSASPFPVSTPAALLTKPKPKRAAKGKTLLAASGLPLPVYVPGPSSSSSPSSSPSPAVSVQAAGTLVVSPQSVNLATALSGTATVRIRAWGGDASWSVQSVPPDLTLTLPDGTQVVPGQSYNLKLGQSVDLTVGLTTGTLDGSTLVTFTVGTTTVSVTVPLPPPVTVPSAVPTDSPSVIPSGL